MKNQNFRLATTTKLKQQLLFSCVVFVIVTLLLSISSTSATVSAAVEEHIQRQQQQQQHVLRRHQQNFQQFRAKKKSVDGPYTKQRHQSKSSIVVSPSEESNNVHDNVNINPFYSPPSTRRQKGTDANRNHNHDLHMNVGGNPWSWSGSSWSFSSASSSSSSSSSSNVPTTTTTPSPGGSSSSHSGSSSSSPPVPTTTTQTPAPGPSSSSNSGGSSADDSSHLFTIYNNCTETIWVAILGNPGFQTISNGGFVMAEAGPPIVVKFPVGWQGRVWARLGCRFNNSGYCNPPFLPCCASGSCLQSDGTFGMYCAQSGISPTSLIEFSLDNPSAYGPYDDYDVSLVDGWSVPLSINPVAGTYNPLPDPGVQTPWCQFSGCYASPACPASLAVNGTTLSCYSPCQAAVVKGTDTHHEIDRACCVCTQSRPQCDCLSSTTQGSGNYECCRGSYGCTPYHTPSYPEDQVCNPWSAISGRGWNSDQLRYINEVETACNKVYSWQFDDKAASFQCRKTNGLVDYDLVFVTRFRDPQSSELFKMELRRKEEEISRLVAIRDGSG